MEIKEGEVKRLAMVFVAVTVATPAGSTAQEILQSGWIFHENIDVLERTDRSLVVRLAEDDNEKALAFRCEEDKHALLVMTGEYLSNGNLITVRWRFDDDEISEKRWVATTNISTNVDDLKEGNDPMSENRKPYKKERREASG